MWLWRILVSRILLAIPTLLLVFTATFLLIQLIPGSPGQTILGERATPDTVTALNERLGYNRPFLIQYLSGLGNLAKGDFGTSLISNRPVIDELTPRVPVTLSIAIGGVIIALVIGLVIGVISAIRGGWIDRGVQFISNLFTATPGFWLAVLLVLVFAIRLRWLPAGGWTSFDEDPTQWARGLILPVVAVGLAGIASIARQARGSLIDTLDKDYVRTLRAAGTSNASLLLKHGLRNAAIPVVANIGFRFVGILGGAVVIEQVFALPGIGQLTLQAVNSHDLPLIQGIVFYVTFIILAVNLVMDVIAAWLNPRMRVA